MKQNTFPIIEFTNEHALAVIKILSPRKTYLECKREVEKQKARSLKLSRH